MPSLWELQITGIDASHVRATGIHRFLSAWFGETTDEHNTIKGYSVRERVDERDGVTLRLGCVSDSLAELVAEIPAGLPVQFGTTYPHNGLVAQPPRCVTEESWDDLKTYQGTTQWRLRFLTPVSLRSDGVDQPWPHPYSVLNGLAAKWERFGPPAQPSYQEEFGRGVGVTGAELRTVLSDRAPRPVFGAEGSVEWTWLGARRCANPDGVPAIERLLRLARFAGMGSYAQFGSGAVGVVGRRADPKRPRARRS